MYRIAVCEDDRCTREDICGQCRRALEELGVFSEIMEFSSAEELESALNCETASFDLLVLDIQLGGKTGLDLAKDRRKLDDQVSILFITGCRDYIPKGYEVRPIHFLMKPVIPSELREAVQTDWRLRRKAERIVFQEGSRTVVVPLRETVYLESVSHGFLVHLTNGEKFLRLPLAKAEQSLPVGQFCRCHNSYLVNIAHISEFCRTEVILRGGGHIPLGRKYSASAQSAFIRYINQ